MKIINRKYHKKKYKDSLSNFDKSRAKVLYCLNSDPEYNLKMKEAQKRKMVLE